jgi:lysine 6-dehydrogenase
MRILVIGAGRMGLGAAYDLANSEQVHEVTLADVDLGRLESVAGRIGKTHVKPVQVDVADHRKIVSLLRGHDAAISCVVYRFNLELARAAIEAGVNFCDLGGNNDIVAAELALDSQARDAGINIIPDCGLAPGMVSMLVAHGASRFDRLHSIRVWDGGLPQSPKPPLNYQIVFSVEGLINEYVEKARVIRGGKIVEIDSMTEVEPLEFREPYVDLEAFQTSGGTSTLPDTFFGRIEQLEYKTIRYAGHCEKIKLLLDLGLAGDEAIEIDGHPVVPRRLLGAMLLRHLPTEGPDVVLIRIDFDGEIGESRRKLRYEIVDVFDDKTGLTAMMRTTAFPASIVAQMMGRGDIKQKGAVPQERCVPASEFVAALAARNIKLEVRTLES